jgi:porphobilinogen deaminase
VTAERTLLSLLGGGCHLPLGCLASEDGEAIRLTAVLGTVDEDITTATVTRVGAVAPTPEEASKACYNALMATAAGDPGP